MVVNIEIEDNPQVKRGRKKKYATAEEARKAKLEQTKASNLRKKNRPNDYFEEQYLKLEAEAEKNGAGIFDYVKGFYDYGKRRVARTIAPIIDPIGTIKDKVKYVKAVAFGATELPPKVRNILHQYGDKKVESIKVCRTPVGSLLTGALNAVSLGAFKKEFKKKPYDKLYHLYLWIKVQGENIILEKNAEINMDIDASVRNGSDTMNVPLPTDRTLTLNEMMANTKNYMKQKFLPYSAKDNNCQDMVMAVLKSNGLGDDAIYNFVQQDTDSLFADDNFLRKVSNTLTDVGARANTAIFGAGWDKKSVKDLEYQFKNFKEITKARRAERDKREKLKSNDSINMKAGRGADEEDDIDWEGLDWGSFTKQMKRFQQQHKNSGIKDLEQFADMILKNPTKYIKRTLDRARFYKNVILKKKGGNLKGFTMGKRKMDDRTPPQSPRLSPTDTANVADYLRGLQAINDTTLQGLLALIPAGISMNRVEIDLRRFTAGLPNRIEARTLNRKLRLLTNFMFADEGITDTEGGNIFTDIGKWGKTASKDIGDVISKGAKAVGSVKNLFGKKKRGRPKKATPPPPKLQKESALDYINRTIPDDADTAMNYMDNMDKEHNLQDDLDYMDSLGSGIKKSKGNNKWISFVKACAKDKGISYRDALKDPNTKALYKKGAGFWGDFAKGFTKVLDIATLPVSFVNPAAGLAIGGLSAGTKALAGQGVKRNKRGGNAPTNQEAYIADLYDSIQLGANAGKYDSL